MKSTAQVGLGAAMVTGLVRATHASATEESLARQAKYQYSVRCIIGPELEERLNAAGADGWHLVALAPATCNVGGRNRPGFPVVIEK